MAISDQQLNRFIALYQEQFGILLDKQTAYDEACKLIRMVKLTCFGKMPEGSTMEPSDTGINKSQQSIEYNEG